MHRTISSWQCQFLPRVVAAAKNTTMVTLAVTLLSDRRSRPKSSSTGTGIGVDCHASGSRSRSVDHGTPRQVKTLVRTSLDSCRGTAGERPLTLAVILSLRLGAV